MLNEQRTPKTEVWEEMNGDEKSYVCCEEGLMKN